MPNALRILVIAGEFHPEPGGPPTYLYHLLPELLARGHAVRVLTYGEADAPQDYPYLVTRISRAQSIPARLAAFSRLIWQHTDWADVLFVQAYALPAIPALLRTRRPMVIKIVSDAVWEFSMRHGWIAPEVDVTAFQRLPKTPRVRLARLQQQVGLQLARAVIVPSQHVAALVQGWSIPADKIHVILNAIPPERDLPPTPEAARAALGLPAEGPLLLGVGRLTAVKGFDVSIRALATLPGARLAIVGEGEDRAALDALAAELGVAERVIFLGRREHRDVMTAMRACDVFVLSSRTEGLSHVLLEALGEGKPIVATRVGGNPEVLTNGQNGLLVTPDNPAALSEAIGRVLADPALADQLRAGAQARSRDFSWDTLVNRTEGLLLAAAEGDKNHEHTAGT